MSPYQEVILAVPVVIMIAGLLFYWRLSWWGSGNPSDSTLQKLKTDMACVFRAPSTELNTLQTQTFGTFFLGGKKVGGELTGNTNWSLCFAFANAIWYFAYLGYTYGIWAFLLQVPWTAAVFGLALLFENYLKASSNGTVHGFIGSLYGSKTAVLAAVVTCTGYTLNCGFEIFYSIYLLCVVFDLQKFSLLISLFTVFFISSCIVAGGYSANVRTNIWKNYIGLFALILLLAFLVPPYLHKFAHWSDAFVGPFELARNSMPSWDFAIGVGIFAFFFNFVDMANWQSLAANQDLNQDEKKSVVRDLKMSAYVQLLAPGFLGACLGVMIKSLENPGSQVAQSDYFKFAFSNALGDISIGTAVVLGIIFFGFISITIASVDAYLLAAMQTLAVDLFKRSKVAEVNNTGLSSERRRDAEVNVIRWCKRGLPLVGCAMVIVFAALYYYLKDNVFSYQFVMYGAAVTLFPIVFVGLIDKKRLRGPVVSSTWAFCSILVGVGFVFVPFFASNRVSAQLSAIGATLNADQITNLTPLFGLTTASIVFFLGWIVRKYWSVAS
jgi:hypothetical protein